MNKVVLDGGPNRGKTTLAGVLKSAGFPVVNEKATEVILGGGPLPWIDHEAFQYEVLCKQLAGEGKLDSLIDPDMADALGCAFYDGSVYTGIAYRLIHGRSVPDFLRRLRPNRYSVCIVPELVPVWCDNGVRYEDPTFSRELAPVLKWVYAKAGVDVMEMPFDCVARRFEYTLSQLKVKPPRLPDMRKLQLAA